MLHMSMQKYLVPLLVGGFLVAGVAFAQNGEETGVDLVDPAEVVTSGDLGVEDPGILPTSRLYFFKEWGRGIQRFFTFNSVKKAELELRFVNEKAAEAKKVEELRPEDNNAIKKALENYQKAQVRLTARFEAVKDTSENPNVDRLLGKFTERAVLHEKLFEQLQEKYEEKTEIKDVLKGVRVGIEEAVGKAAEKDTPEKFAEKLQEALEAAPGSSFKHLRSLDFVDRVKEQLPEEKRVQLEEVRNTFAQDLKERIEKFVEEGKDQEILEQTFLNIPGDAVRHSVILEEIKVRAPEGLRGVFEGVSKGLERGLEQKEDAKEKATERIKEAKDRIEKLEARVAEKPELQEKIAPLLEQARAHVAKAQEAFEQANYGETFGQARSSEVLARNGLRILETERELEDLEEEELEEKEDAKEEAAEMIEETQEKIQTLIRLADGLKEESQAALKLRSIIQEAQDHLANAQSLFGEGQYREAWHGARQAFVVAKHGFQLFEGVRHLEEKDREKAEEFGEGLIESIRDKRGKVLCTQEYRPVCGVNGRTYSNRCIAEQQAGVKVAYSGECKKGQPSCPTVDERACKARGGELVTTNVYDPECGDKVICVVPTSPPTPIPPPRGEEIMRKVGEMESSFLIQKINPDSVDGLWYQAYPVARGEGEPRTLRIGDDIGYACKGVSEKLITINFPDQTITFHKVVGEPPFGGCPICLASNTLIDTPSGKIPVQDLQVGMSVWTQDKTGQRISSVITKTSKVKVPLAHQMVHLILDDGKELFVSPGHPIIDRRTVGDLAPGDLYDGVSVQSTERVPYSESATYDILPSGDTGFYWANSILMGSTLR